MTIASKHYKSQRNQAPATKYKNPLSQKDGGFFCLKDRQNSNNETKKLSASDYNNSSSRMMARF